LRVCVSGLGFGLEFGLSLAFRIQGFVSILDLRSIAFPRLKFGVLVLFQLYVVVPVSFSGFDFWLLLNI
jgi:hypothetical protein